MKYESGSKKFRYAIRKCQKGLVSVAIAMTVGSAVGQQQVQAETASLPVSTQLPVNQKNVTDYLAEDGSKRQIVWVKGIQAPQMGPGGDFKKEVDWDFVSYKMPFKENQGWYDVNKSLTASAVDLNLCFAAVSSNMLHWWLQQNQAYVEQYIQQTYGEQEVAREKLGLRDLRRYVDSFTNQQESRIFDLFKVYYGYRTDGYLSDLLIDLFINGYSPKPSGGTNQENPELVPDERGGFFHSVFKGTKLTDRFFSGNYDRFGKDVKERLEAGQILGVTHLLFRQNNSHIVTLWGAEYDEEGNLRAIYVTDSDDQSTPVGMKRYGVTKDRWGNPRLNDHTKDPSRGVAIEYIHSLSLGQDSWERYFHPVDEELLSAKESAKTALGEAAGTIAQAIKQQEELGAEEQASLLARLEEARLKWEASLMQAATTEEVASYLKQGLEDLQPRIEHKGEAAYHKQEALTIDSLSTETTSPPSESLPDSSGEGAELVTTSSELPSDSSSETTVLETLPSSAESPVDASAGSNKREEESQSSEQTTTLTEENLASVDDQTSTIANKETETQLEDPTSILEQEEAEKLPVLEEKQEDSQEELKTEVVAPPVVVLQEDSNVSTTEFEQPIDGTVISVEGEQQITSPQVTDETSTSIVEDPTITDEKLVSSQQPEVGQPISTPQQSSEGREHQAESEKDDRPQDATKEAIEATQDRADEMPIKDKISSPIQKESAQATAPKQATNSQLPQTGEDQSLWSVLAIALLGLISFYLRKGAGKNKRA